MFTIPPHRAFTDALVAGLLSRSRADPLALARALILLPNNRAVRAVQDAFVRRADRGLILPRLVAIGDPDLDEAIGAALDPIDDEAPIPPAVEPMARRMILARLVEEERANAGEPVDAAEAVRLAADLARTLDQLAVERRALPICSLWAARTNSPNIGSVLCDVRGGRAPLAGRAREAGADRSLRSARAASVQAERRWRTHPPAGPVIAAGITTPAPAIAALMRRVASMADGMVVFPGLDLLMPEAEWESLGPHDPDSKTGLHRRSIETHPQFALKLLLDRMSVARSEVATWRWGSRASARRRGAARSATRWRRPSTATNGRR